MLWPRLASSRAKSKSCRSPSKSVQRISSMQSHIYLPREIEAIQIPSGDSITLPMGMRVIITQALGGTYTVATDQGLARVMAKDADALGIKPEEKKEKGEHADSSNIPADVGDLEMEVWQQL